MDVIDSSCGFDNAEAKRCFDSHTVRNLVWAQNINTTLNQSNRNRVVAYMHRWHAVRAAGYQEGLDTFVKVGGVSTIRFIDFIGGTACYSKRSCRGYSDEKIELKRQYFYREGFPFKSAVKSYQVHLPENSILSREYSCEQNNSDSRVFYSSFKLPLISWNFFSRA